MSYPTESEVEDHLNLLERPINGKQMQESVDMVVQCWLGKVENKESKLQLLTFINQAENILKDLSGGHRGLSIAHIRQDIETKIHQLTIGKREQIEELRVKRISESLERERIDRLMDDILNEQGIRNAALLINGWLENNPDKNVIGFRCTVSDVLYDLMLRDQMYYDHPTVYKGIQSGLRSCGFEIATDIDGLSSHTDRDLLFVRVELIDMTQMQIDDDADLIKRGWRLVDDTWLPPENWVGPER